MTNIFNSPWDEERQRRLLAPPIGVRPYQSNLSPGQMYGKFSSGSGGITPLPSPMPKIGPAPLPPNIQTPSPRDPNNEYWTQDKLDKIGPVLDHTGNPAPGWMPPKLGDPVTTPMPTIPVYGGGQNQDPRYRPMIPGPEPIGGLINPPGQGGGYSGAQWEGLDMSGFNPTGPQTTDMTPYTINGETYYGSSSWLGKLEEYLNSTGQGDAFGRPDTSFGFQQPKQGPPNTRWDDSPGGITPLPSPPNAGTGGPLPPGGGINRPSRPSNPPDYRLALPHPGIGRPYLPNKPHPKPVPFQGQGYNRQATSSASPSPAWGIGKTKRKFGT